MCGDCVSPSFLVAVCMEVLSPSLLLLLVLLPIGILRRPSLKLLGISIIPSLNGKK